MNANPSQFDQPPRNWHPNPRTYKIEPAVLNSHDHDLLMRLYVDMRCPVDKLPCFPTTLAGLAARFANGKVTYRDYDRNELWHYLVTCRKNGWLPKLTTHNRGTVPGNRTGEGDGASDG